MVREELPNGACPGVTINVIRHLQGQKDATAVGSPCQDIDDFLSEKPRESVSSALTLVHAIPLTYHLKSEISGFRHPGRVEAFEVK